MAKMKAPRGTDEASVGTHLYRVDNSGEVDASPEDVAGLASAGFIAADAPLPEVPVGSVRLRGPENVGGVSFGGQEYPADDRGHVIVPAAAVADLASHGFNVVETVSSTENPEPAPKSPAQADADTAAAVAEDVALAGGEAAVEAAALEPAPADPPPPPPAPELAAEAEAAPAAPAAE